MSTLSHDYQRTLIVRPRPLPTGPDAVFAHIAGLFRNSPLVSRRLRTSAMAIETYRSAMERMSDDQLKASLRQYRSIFRRHKTGHEQSILSALAAVRESARRSLGLDPYRVQMAGALGLAQGHIIEMATGEGKTLTAGLYAVLLGWTGLPAHIITVNDYLAERDSRWLKPLYDYCGVSAGAVTGVMSPVERRENYLKDITYVTAKEMAADFLRDRLFLGLLQKYNRRQIRSYLGMQARFDQQLVMRGIHSAIVDEADSVLIDEAVTPLIISSARNDQFLTAACFAAARLAGVFDPLIDYQVDTRYHEVRITGRGRERLVAAAAGFPVMFQGVHRLEELMEQALTAREFYIRDKQYVLDQGKVVIVDEFTGRKMAQRSWQAGLHQMIEAKENLDISPMNETLARLSFQRFFRFFHRLCGMTGTAREARQELWQVYGLTVVPILENKPCQRQVYKRQIRVTHEAKWQAITEEISRIHHSGRPVLIGTRSVRISEDLSRRLDRLNLSHRVLNAVQHKEEAAIVAQAGQHGAITVATNMAGRGTDILLGNGVAALGGLHVIATECHESRRIDRQLFGRAARQGDAGSARSFVSLDDELLCRYLPEAVRQRIAYALEQGHPGAYQAAQGLIHWAQAAALRSNSQRRRSVLQADTWLEDGLSFGQGDIA